MRKVYSEAPLELRIALRLSEPGSDPRMAVDAILDCGSDGSCVPAHVREVLGLPKIWEEDIVVGDDILEGKRDVVECVVLCDKVGVFPLRMAVYGKEVILGMDWLNLVHACYGYSAGAGGWILEIVAAPGADDQ